MLKNIFDRLIPISSLVVLAACAAALNLTNLKPGDGIHPDFQPYVDRFNELASLNIDGYCQPKIDIGYGNLKNLDINENKGDSYTIGVCFYTKTPMVLFDTENWNRYDDAKREMLVFHELGHCILDLDHNEAEFESSEGLKQKTSIMYPMIFDTQTYLSMRDYYLSELFSATKKTKKDWEKSCGKNHH